MEKQLVLELSEVILSWDGKPSDVNLRVSIQGEVQTLRLKSSGSFAVKSLNNDVQLHILAQSGNIALASITYRLNTLIKPNKDSFDNLIELKVPGAVLKTLVPGISTTKIVKIRLMGRIQKKNAKNKEKAAGAEKEIQKDAKIEDFESKIEKNEEKNEISIEKNESLSKEESKVAEPEILIDSNKSVDEVSLKAEEKPVKPSEVTPRKSLLPLIQLSSSSIQSKCSYISRIKNSEFHLSEISRILNRLRSELGSNFSKFLQESLRRDKSPPLRKPTITSQKKLGDLSQISFTSTYKQEDNDLEIPSFFDLIVEKLSSKNAKQLLCALVSLLAKTTYYESITNESKHLRIHNEKHEESISTIEKSIQESSSEFKEICGHGGKLIEDVKERLRSKKLVLSEKKAQQAVINHEKEALGQKLRKVKEENAKIKMESDPGGKIGIVIDLRKEIEEIEHKRKSLEEGFRDYSEKMKADFLNLTAEQIRVAENKANLYRKIKDLDQESEDFARENWSFSNQISKLEGISEVCQGFQDLCDENIQEISNLRNLTSELSNSFFKIRASKDESSQIFTSLISSLNSKLQLSDAFEKSLKNETQLLNSKISKAASETDRSVSKSEELASLILAYEDLPKAFEQLKYKLEHNKEIRDQVINEIYFFSDFIFSMSQTFLFQSRINHKVKAIAEEKDFDVQAMRESLAHFKIKNPVYHPAKADPIDKALADYLNSRNSVLPLPFVRDSYGIYYYGTRKVNVTQERNKLTVKVGGGFLPIDEFIENYTEIELEKFEKRNQEITPQMKKLMAKWVGGITGDPGQAKGKLKENLVSAVKDQRFSTAYAVRENSPKIPERTESFERPETPVIGDD